MAVTVFDVEIYQGTTWVQEITAVGIDLTGLTGKCSMRKQASADSVVVASPTVTVIDATTGVYSLTLTATETLAIPVTAKTLTDFSTFLYDVVFSDVGGVVQKTTMGQASVFPAVTR